MPHVNRRELIALVAGLAGWPPAADAQQADRIRRIAMLISAYTPADREGQARVAAFIERLQRLGWTDGRNVQINTRAGLRPTPTSCASMLSNWLRSHPTSIAGGGTAIIASLLQATRTVPIVFAVAVDPVGAGFVSSLARPGGNATGFTVFELA